MINSYSWLALFRLQKVNKVVSLIRININEKIEVPKLLLSLQAVQLYKLYNQHLLSAQAVFHSYGYLPLP